MTDYRSSHAPMALKNDTMVWWAGNTTNLSGVSTQYGYGCLDGMVNTLRVDGNGNVFLSAVDAGAHFARHLYNAAKSVLFRDDVDTLEEALRAGRAYDFSYPVSLPAGTGILSLKRYYELYLMAMFTNMGNGFVNPNYVRPFYGPSETRLDGVENDFSIDGSAYSGRFTIMSMYWPGILGPRKPEFEGGNVLLTTRSTSPHPEGSFIQFKHASGYALTRGPAVAEKVAFNRRFGSAVMAHDILLLDPGRQYITEASGSNLFLLHNGMAMTPVADGSIFPGLSRDILLRFIRMFGEQLGIDRVSEGDITLEATRRMAAEGAELFFAGSALGIFPVKTLIVPKHGKPSDKLDDYEMMEFRTGTDTKTAVLRDMYRCFSIGRGFEVLPEKLNGTGARECREFTSWPLLMEVPKELRTKAVEMLTLGTNLPFDQQLPSNKVRPLHGGDNRIAANNAQAGRRSQRRAPI